MFADVADTRIVAATSATLTFQGRDSDGEPADPGTVTVQVVTDAGSVVIAAGTAPTTPEDEPDTRTVTLSPSQTSSIDRLTAIWTSSGVELGRTVHDIVGGVYCTVAEIRADPSNALADDVKHPAAKLVRARTEIEYQIERRTHRAFVPRFATQILDGSGTESLVLEHPDLRSVVTVEYWAGSEWLPLSVIVGNIPPSSAGIAELRSTTWPRGHENIRIRYVHGMDRPPADLKDAAVEAVGHHLAGKRSGIDPRALSMVSPEGGTIQLATPGRGIWVTGIPEIDEVIDGYTFRRIGVA